MAVGSVITDSLNRCMTRSHARRDLYWLAESAPDLYLHSFDGEIPDDFDCVCFYYKIDHSSTSKIVAHSQFTLEQKVRAQLFELKMEVYYKIKSKVNFARTKCDSPFICQQQIYEEKYKEAMLVAGGFVTIAFPYVSAYAELNECTLEVAAQEIIRKFSANEEEHLFRTEVIRMKCMRALQNAKTIQETIAAGTLVTKLFDLNHLL